jgi:S-DNA-T family DNA segregation ATPase FtsK/SpoIIIE
MMVVKKAGKWSTSLIQRKLSLWYARAAKVLDILEELGVVWPANGSKPREVYID